MSATDNRFLESTVLTLNGTNNSGNQVTKGSAGDVFLDVNSRRIRGGQTPLDSDEFAIKDYVDTQLASVSAGAGIIKETLLSAHQLDDSEGIRPAFLIFLATGDTILATEEISLISDTHSVETVVEGTDFTGQVSAAADMQELAAAINSTTNFSGFYIPELTQFNATEGAILVFTLSTPSSSDDFRIWSNSSSNLQVVSFFAETATDTSQTEPASNYELANARGTFTISNGDPGGSVDYSGVLRQTSDLSEPETHVVLDTGSWYTWDADQEQWNLSNNPVGDATSGAGGGTKGQVTVDQNYALYLASAILRLQLESSDPTLEFKAGTPSQLGVKYGATSGLDQDSDGLLVATDDVSIEKNSSGELQVVLPLTTPQIESAILSSTDITNGYIPLTYDITVGTNLSATLCGFNTNTNTRIPYQVNGLDFTIMRKDDVDYVVWKTSGNVDGGSPTGSYPTVGLVGVLEEDDALHVVYTRTLYEPTA